MDLFDFARNEPTEHSPIYLTDEPDYGEQSQLGDWE